MKSRLKGRKLKGQNKTASKKGDKQEVLGNKVIHGRVIKQTTTTKTKTKKNSSKQIKTTTQVPTNKKTETETKFPEGFFNYSGYADEIPSFPKKHFNKLVYLDPFKKNRLYVMDPTTLSRKQRKKAITLETLKIMLTNEDWDHHLYVNRHSDLHSQSEGSDVEDAEYNARNDDEEIALPENELIEATVVPIVATEVNVDENIEPFVIEATIADEQATVVGEELPAQVELQDEDEDQHQERDEDQQQEMDQEVVPNLMDAETNTDNDNIIMTAELAENDEVELSDVRVQIVRSAVVLEKESVNQNDKITTTTTTTTTTALNNSLQMDIDTIENNMTNNDNLIYTHSSTASTSSTSSTTTTSLPTQTILTTNNRIESANTIQANHPIQQDVNSLTGLNQLDQYHLVDDHRQRPVPPMSFQQVPSQHFPLEFPSHLPIHPLPLQQMQDSAALFPQSNQEFIYEAQNRLNNLEQQTKQLYQQGQIYQQRQTLTQQTPYQQTPYQRPINYQRSVQPSSQHLKQQLQANDDYINFLKKTINGVQQQANQMLHTQQLFGPVTYQLLPGQMQNLNTNALQGPVTYQLLPSQMQNLNTNPLQGSVTYQLLPSQMQNLNANASQAPKPAHHGYLPTTQPSSTMPFASPMNSYFPLQTQNPTQNLGAFPSSSTMVLPHSQLPTRNNPTLSAIPSRTPINNFNFVHYQTPNNVGNPKQSKERNPNLGAQNQKQRFNLFPSSSSTTTTTTTSVTPPLFEFPSLLREILPDKTESYYYANEKGVEDFTKELWDAIRTPEPNGSLKAINLIKILMNHTIEFSQLGFDINAFYEDTNKDHEKFPLMKPYRSTRKKTLIVHAATHNKMNVIEFLMSNNNILGVKPKFKFGHHEGLLEYGVHNNNLDIVKLALNKKANAHRRLDTKRRSKWRTAMICAMELGYTDIVKLIAENTSLKILNDLKQFAENENDFLITSPHPCNDHLRRFNADILTILDTVIKAKKAEEKTKEETEKKSSEKDQALNNIQSINHLTNPYVPNPSLMFLNNIQSINHHQANPSVPNPSLMLQQNSHIQPLTPITSMPAGMTMWHLPTPSVNNLNMDAANKNKSNPSL